MTVAEYVAASTKAQGLPLKVQDENVLRQVAAMIIRT
jgi:hypothetical protein